MVQANDAVFQVKKKENVLATKVAEVVEIFLLTDYCAYNLLPFFLNVFCC